MASCVWGTGGVILTRAQLPKLVFIESPDHTITYGVCTTIKQNPWNELFATINHVDTKGLGEIAIPATVNKDKDGVLRYTVMGARSVKDETKIDADILTILKAPR
jgi:hypothetical protein|eukprot:7025969-Prymnesium_polylepis.1